MAYLVSIYGTPSFNPSLLSDAPQGLLTTSNYGKALSLLPSYIAAFMPSAETVAAVNAPIPDKDKKLTPAQMKKALISLSTKNALVGDLPVGTPNLYVLSADLLCPVRIYTLIALLMSCWLCVCHPSLAFNNYTTSG